MWRKGGGCHQRSKGPLLAVRSPCIPRLLRASRTPCLGTELLVLLSGAHSGTTARMVRVRVMLRHICPLPYRGRAH